MLNMAMTILPRRRRAVEGEQDGLERQQGFDGGSGAVTRSRMLDRWA